jgi:hypothetical protein
MVGLQSLTVLGKHNRIRMIRSVGTASGKELAGFLTRQGYETPFAGSEAA